MPSWTPPVDSGQTSGIATAINGVRDDTKNWKGLVNANNQSLAHVNILDAAAVYSGGRLVPAQSYNQLVATPVTGMGAPMSSLGNPLAFTFSAPAIGNISVVAGGAIAPATDYAITGGPQLVTLLNGGFESDFANWLLFSPEIVTATANHGGTYSAAIIGLGGYLAQAIGGLTPGASVTLAVWVRGDSGGTSTGYLSVGGTAVVYSTTVTPGLTWQQVTATCTVPPSGVISLYLVRGGSGTGNIYFDDVTTTLGTLVNPGFEAGGGSLTGWNAFPDATITTTGTHGGAKAAALVGDNAYIYQSITGLPPNLFVTVSGYARTDAGAAITAYIVAQNGAGVDISHNPNPPLTLTTDWQLISFMYQVDNTGAIGIAPKRGVGTGTVYFDDFLIVGRSTAVGVYTITFVDGTEPYEGESVMVIGATN